MRRTRCRLLRGEAQGTVPVNSVRGSPKGEMLSAKLDEVPPLVLNISFPLVICHGETSAGHYCVTT